MTEPTKPEPREERWDQDPHSPFGRFGMFIKASERWDPALLLGSHHGGRPDIVVSLADLRDVYADRNRLRAELAELRKQLGTAESEWGYGHDPDDVDPIGDRNAARDCARAYGASVFVRSVISGPWRPDDGGD